MGLIARVLEDVGIATVCILMRREVAQNVKPPRTLFVHFPLGAPLGPANEANTHREVIRQALEVLSAAQALCGYNGETTPCNNLVCRAEEKIHVSAIKR